MNNEESHTLNTVMTKGPVQSNQQTKPEVRVYSDLDALSQAAAEEIFLLAHAAIAEKGLFTVALAGGSTPRRLYQILAEKYRDKIDWAKVHFFWGDERCVPLTDSDSNFTMAAQALISKVSVPSQNVHRMPADVATPEQAAQAYERELRDFFKLFSVKSFPAFDLVLLGIGEDGHTASLFPNAPVLDEKVRWVSPVTAPATYKTRPRITLTLPVLNNAYRVFFLVAGSEKHTVIKSILNTPEPAQKLYPAAMIRPRGQTTWFLDKTAGGE